MQILYNHFSRNLPKISLMSYCFFFSKSAATPAPIWSWKGSLCLAPSLGFWPDDWRTFKTPQSPLGSWPDEPLTKSKQVCPKLWLRTLHSLSPLYSLCWTRILSHCCAAEVDKSRWLWITAKITVRGRLSQGQSGGNVSLMLWPRTIFCLLASEPRHIEAAHTFRIPNAIIVISIAVGSKEALAWDEKGHIPQTSGVKDGQEIYWMDSGAGGMLQFVQLQQTSILGKTTFCNWSPLKVKFCRVEKGKPSPFCWKSFWECGK